METIPQIYDIAKSLYDKLNHFVLKMIQFAEKKDLEEKDVYIDMDHFIQAILFKVALADDVLVDVELEFVKKIAKYDDLFKDYALVNLSLLSSNERNKLSKICDEVLEKVPLFVELSVICDKKVDSLTEVISPTYCQEIYDYLRRIANYLKFIDGSVKVSEDKTSKMVLQSVVTYYKKHYVKYAPERKK